MAAVATGGGPDHDQIRIVMSEGATDWLHLLLMFGAVDPEVTAGERQIYEAAVMWTSRSRMNVPGEEPAGPAHPLRGNRPGLDQR